jgi:hypothetical protein
VYPGLRSKLAKRAKRVHSVSAFHKKHYRDEDKVDSDDLSLVKLDCDIQPTVESHIRQSRHAALDNTHFKFGERGVGKRMDEEKEKD